MFQVFSFEPLANCGFKQQQHARIRAFNASVHSVVVRLNFFLIVR